MFCPNCGNKLNGNEDFCSNCGYKLTTTYQQTIPTTSEIISKKNEILQNKIKKFISTYKKQCIIGVCCLSFVILSIILFNSLFGFTTLSWNKEYNDINLNYVSQTNIKLGINFSDKNKLKEIKYTTNCGKIDNNELELTWDLSDQIGKCEITASYKLRKISKEYTVINSNINEDELSLTDEIDVNSDEDLDLDGLTNKEETKNKTDVLLSDSDMDGLDDYYELYTSKTDPNIEDTDSDGINDFNEIKLQLDPLKKDSKNDGIDDKERNLSYTIHNDDIGVTIDINGKGNIASTTVNTFINERFTDEEGILDKVYNFYTAGILDKANVKISYNMEDIEKKGLNEDSLTLYYFNEDNKQLEEVSTIVDKENKILSVELNHFSQYLIGDKNLVIKDKKNQIMMVIDNSVSMFTYSQLTQLGYYNITGADGNDSEFKRISLSKQLVDMFTGNYSFGIAEFAGDYVNLEKFTDNKKNVKSSIDLIKTNERLNTTGTDIVNALENGINEFSKNDNGHYLILLTDGKDTSETLSFSKNTIIEKAKDKSIKVCVIGIGSELDTNELNEIAESTGCDYFNASNSSALDEIYSIVGSSINYNLVDTDKDGKVDGTIIADNGFVSSRDGFSFHNYASNLSTKGHCYGMAMVAQLYYTKKLPISVNSKNVINNLGEEENSYEYNLKDTYFENYSNLYDYKLQTNELKHYSYFGHDYFNEEIPSDYRILHNTDLIFNNKYKNEIEKANFFDIALEKSTYSKERQIEKWGTTFTSAETTTINEDKMQNSSMKYSDIQIFNAIYTAHIKQHLNTYYLSSMSLKDKIGTFLGYTSYKKTTSNEFINLLTSRINNGEPIVISWKYNGEGGHAVNAIDVIQDIENANYYYIGVYDNNYPGEKRYIDLKCNEDTCVTVANDYYKGNKQPIKITESIEYDLKYYNN